MSPAIARIVLRYLAAGLVSYGLLAPDEAHALVGDPHLVADVAAVVGILTGAVVEGWYTLAKRLGWKT